MGILEHRITDRDPPSEQTAQSAHIDDVSDDRPPERIDPADAEAVALGRAQAIENRFATDEEIAAIYRRAGL